MSAVVAAVHLKDLNGMPADDTINTFVFMNNNATTDPTTLATDVQTHIEDFYNVGAAQPLNAFLGDSLDVGPFKSEIVFYQLAPLGSIVPVTPLGGPLLTTAWTLGGHGAQSLPRECAACLSYHGIMAGLPEDVPGGAVGPAGDTHPAARHRGRLYLGPLATAASGVGVNGPGISSFMRVSATNAAAALLAAVAAIPLGTCSWAVWSRTNHALYPITGGWMDDAFDTQRRRGIKATQRTTF